MPTMIQLICDECGKEFERKLSQHKWSEKVGRRVLCSRRCCGKAYCRSSHEKHNTHPMQYLWSRMRGSAYKKGIEICSKDDLKTLWDKQEGRCAISNLPMKYVNQVGDADPFQASVDRIDSTGEYTADNIQLVCLAVNYAKHTWTQDTIIEFLMELRNVVPRGSV